MSIISVIGPKGGIGKTTLSINTAASLIRRLPHQNPDQRVCLVDLDLRLPTIASLLDSHPKKTFYDLFEALANKTYQVDFLRSLYHILTRFQAYINGELEEGDEKLTKSLALFKNINSDLFSFSEFEFGDTVYELFLNRGQIHSPSDLKIIEEPLKRIDLKSFRLILKNHEENSWPILESYVNYIEEYAFSIIGGEVPILGKRAHRKRINEPEFLVLFLDFLDELFKKFDHVILDTPAGGVNHLSSLMNSIDQVIFVFDVSNNIAIHGSIDALHSFIDYYEDFHDDFVKGRLTGLDRVYANRVVAEGGHEALSQLLQRKKMGIVFNRYKDSKQIEESLDQLREYLDTLDKLDTYKNRIHILGMIPQHRIINITNNRGALFYDKDRSLSAQMDLVTESTIGENGNCPTLACENQEIVQYLQTHRQPGLVQKFVNYIHQLQFNESYDRKKAESSQY